MRKHIQRVMGDTMRNKLMFRSFGWKQTVVKSEPMIIELSMTKKEFQNVIRNDDIHKKICESLTEFGAKEGIDFDLRVV